MTALRYYITDSSLLPTPGDVVERIARNLRDGVEFIQIREKDLCARDLLALTRRVMALPNPHETRILVNTRADVAAAAAAAGAQGVHLPTDSIEPGLLRNIFGQMLIVSVAAHSLEEAQAAEDEGASMVLFGPVFLPLSKSSLRPPLGLAELAKAAARVSIPVFALGGIDIFNAPSCIAAGAAGVAGITMFQGD